MASERRKITMTKTQISCMSKKVLYDYFLRTFKYYSPLQNSRIRLKVIFTQFLQNSKGTEMKKKHSWHLFHFRSETPADICGIITVNFCLSLTGQTIIQITQVYSSRWQTENFFTLLMITITLKGRSEYELVIIISYSASLGRITVQVNSHTMTGRLSLVENVNKSCYAFSK